MSITYLDPAKRHKQEAFEIIARSGHEPLQKAIACVLEMQGTADILSLAMESCSIEDRPKLALALAKCLPDQFNAWIKVAEFIYAKPKQALEVSGNLTLEQLLGHWDQPKQIGVVE